MVGPHVYEIEEANELIPMFEEAFVKLDGLRERIKDAKIKLNALEMIWGTNLNEEDNPDHHEGRSLLEELQSLEDRFKGSLHNLNDANAHVKDFEKGIVDVYHVREGRLVFLCWSRGEDAFDNWHHVDAGFTDRQPLE